MKMRYVLLSEEQIETLKTTVSMASEDAEDDVEDTEEYRAQLKECYDALSSTVTVEGLAREIHDLKNVIQRMQLKDALKEKRS